MTEKPTTETTATSRTPDPKDDVPTASPEPAVRRLRWISLALAAALIASLVAVGLLWRDRDEPTDSYDVAATAQSADEAARRAAAAMSTYDFRTVDQQFSDVNDLGTETFAGYWTGASSKLAQYVKAQRAVARGTVIDSAARVDDADHAHVLVYVDQRIRVQGSKDDRIDQPRLSLEMVREQGRWLVDSIQLNNNVSG